jgi:hypothetical protein
LIFILPTPDKLAHLKPRIFSIYLKLNKLIVPINDLYD